MYSSETLGLSMEIFKYEYNLSRKNIKNNKPIHTLIVFRFCNICSRQSDFNTNRFHWLSRTNFTKSLKNKGINRFICFIFFLDKLYSYLKISNRKSQGLNVCISMYVCTIHTTFGITMVYLPWTSERMWIRFSDIWHVMYDIICQMYLYTVYCMSNVSMPQNTKSVHSHSLIWLDPFQMPPRFHNITYRYPRTLATVRCVTLPWSHFAYKTFRFWPIISKKHIIYVLLPVIVSKSNHFTHALGAQQTIVHHVAKSAWVVP